jgi:hypothetical protein
MKNIISTFNKNRALFLILINTLLLLGVVIQKDPLHLFEKTYESSEKFYKANLSEISKITYKRKNEDSSQKKIELTNSIWMLFVSNGNSYLADEEKVSQLLKALLEARKFTIATSGKEKFSDYGLDSSDTFVVELFKGETSLGKMALGNAGGGGSFTHILWNDSEDIYIVEDSIKPLLGRGADDFFINKRITPISINSSDILSVSLVSNVKNKNYILKKKDSKWFLGEKELEVGTEKISGLLNKLSSLVADGVVEAKNLPKLSEADSAELQFSYKDPVTSILNSITLKILGKDSSNIYYLQKQKEEAIYTFQDYQLKTLLNTEF